MSDLERHFREPVDIKAIARQAGTSSSTLHEHFMRSTSLSPIQLAENSPKGISWAL